MNAGVPTESEPRDYPYISGPTCLAECLELLSRPVARDHYLIREADNLNQVSIQEVIAGIGTEKIEDSKKRQEAALYGVRIYMDEITSRTSMSLGISLINSLLCLEIDTDDDGVPLDEDEANVCDHIARLMLRVEAVSQSQMILADFFTRILLDKETLLYNKYKLLKAVRVACRSLTSWPADGSFSLHRRNVQSLVPIANSKSTLAVLNDFAANVSLAFDRALVGLLSNQEILPTNNVLIGEIMLTLIELANFTKDVGHIASSIIEISDLVRETTDVEVVKGVLRMILTDQKTLEEILCDREGTRKLLLMTKILKARVDLSQDISELLDAIHNCVEPAEHTY